MRVNVLSLALQVMQAVDAVTNLNPGDVNPLPVVHITDKDEHISIAITVSRDAQPADETTNLQASKG